MILTDREKDVMRLVARGYTNQEVCKKLCIEYSTMRSHLDAAYKKMSRIKNGKKIKMTRVRAVLIYLGLAKAEDFINE